MSRPSRWVSAPAPRPGGFSKVPQSSLQRSLGMSPVVGSPQLSGELSSAASPPPQPVTANGPTTHPFGLPLATAVPLGGGGGVWVLTVVALAEVVGAVVTGEVSRHATSPRGVARSAAR